jgi:hypothetical protein
MQCPHCQSEQRQSPAELFGFAQQRCNSCGSAIAIASWASFASLLLVVIGVIWLNSMLRPEISGVIFRGFTAVSMGLCAGALLHAGFRALHIYSRVQDTVQAGAGAWLERPLWRVLVILCAAYGVFVWLSSVKT